MYKGVLSFSYILVLSTISVITGFSGANGLEVIQFSGNDEYPSVMQQDASYTNPSLENIPPEIFEEIASYMSKKEIFQLRSVSKKIDFFSLGFLGNPYHKVTAKKVEDLKDERFLSLINLAEKLIFSEVSEENELKKSEIFFKKSTKFIKSLIKKDYAQFYQLRRYPPNKKFQQFFEENILPLLKKDENILDLNLANQTLFDHVFCKGIDENAFSKITSLNLANTWINQESIDKIGNNLKQLKFLFLNSKGKFFGNSVNIKNLAMLLDLEELTLEGFPVEVSVSWVQAFRKAGKHHEKFRGLKLSIDKKYEEQWNNGRFTTLKRAFGKYFSNFEIKNN